MRRNGGTDDMTTKALPHEWTISFMVEVIPEEGDTLEGLRNFVKDMVTEWLPEDFVFDVRPVSPGKGTT